MQQERTDDVSIPALGSRVKSVRRFRFPLFLLLVDLLALDDFSAG
jgi:hypothetical protein